MFRAGDFQGELVKLDWVPVRLGDVRGVAKGLLQELGWVAVVRIPPGRTEDL